MYGNTCVYVAYSALLLEAAMQIAGLDVALDDALAVDGEHDAHGAVHRGMRRAHVDGHQIRRQLRLDVREVLDVLAAEDELLERGRRVAISVCSSLIGLIGRSSRRTSGCRFSFG